MYHGPGVCVLEHVVRLFEYWSSHLMEIMKLYMRQNLNSAAVAKCTVSPQESGKADLHRLSMLDYT